MPDYTLLIIIALLFILYYLVILTQDYGPTGHKGTRDKLNKEFLPLILTGCALLLAGGLSYLSGRGTNGGSSYDSMILTGYCYSIFILSIAVFHNSLYKVNLF